MSERIGVFEFKAFEEKREQKRISLWHNGYFDSKKRKEQLLQDLQRGLFFRGNVGWAVGEIYSCFVPNLKMWEKAEIRFRTVGASFLCMKVVSDPGWISIKKFKLLSDSGWISIKKLKLLSDLGWIFIKKLKLLSDLGGFLSKSSNYSQTQGGFLSKSSNYSRT